MCTQVYQEIKKLYDFSQSSGIEPLNLCIPNQLLIQLCCQRQFPEESWRGGTPSSLEDGDAKPTLRDCASAKPPDSAGSTTSQADG